MTLAAHLLVTRVEQPELRERFGRQFETYCRRDHIPSALEIEFPNG